MPTTVYPDLSRDALQPYADRLGIEVAVLQAVIAVESGRLPWVLDEAPLTRLEVHAVWGKWPEDQRGLLDDFVHVDGFYHYLPKGATRTGPYKNGRWQGHRYCMRAHEVPSGYPMLYPDDRDLAGSWAWVSLHDVAWTPAQQWVQRHAQRRLLSLASVLVSPADQRQAAAAVWGGASYGGLQIMGYNFADGLYTDAKAMFEGFRTVDGQLRGFVSRVMRKPRELIALRTRDFLAFAASYNGGGKPEVYASDMARTYLRYKAQR